MLWTVIFLAVLLGALFVMARYTSSRNGDAVVSALAKILPPLTIAGCIAAFAATPVRGRTSHVLALLVHHAAFSFLFVFLTAAEYIQMEASRKIRSGQPAESIANSYRRLWIMTELAPAPAAFIVFITGLRLIWEAPYSMTSTWLWLLVAGFSVFFFDGLLGYRPIVQTLYLRWKSLATNVGGTVPGVQNVSIGMRIQVFAHFLSLPLLFLIGLCRWDVPNPVSNRIGQIERGLAFVPIAWRGVLVALMTWTAIGVAVSLLRVAAKARRRTS
jgi:hypothetical protein